jgi:hypothetical protein
MRQTFHICVAIDASEQTAVDGVLQLFLIDREAELFAVLLFHQCCVGVASEAVLILQLMLGICNRGPCEQGKSDDLDQEFLRSIHTIEKILCR